MKRQTWHVTPALLEQLSSELLNLNFHIAARVDGRYERFSLETDDGRRTLNVLIPLNAQSVDFEELGLEAIEAAESVANGLGRTANFVNALAGDHQVDVVRFARDAPTRDGSVRWDLGERLFASARSALTVAAKSTFEKQAAFGRELKGVGQQYMNGVRMGQTEVGSFVVTAFSPTDSIVTLPVDARRLSVPTATIDVTATGRDITTTLNEALSATTEIIQDKGTPVRASAFESAVHLGVSKELLTSLADGVGKAGSVEVRLSGPQRGSDFLLGAHVFNAGQVDKIRAGATHLAQAFPKSTVELVGRVELLARPKPGEFGIVRLEVMDGSLAKSVKIRLTEAQFEIAAASISSEQFVRIRGVQEREGDTFWVYSPRIVSVDGGQIRLI